MGELSFKWRENIWIRPYFGTVFEGNLLKNESYCAASTRPFEFFQTILKLKFLFRIVLLTHVGLSYLSRFLTKNIAIFMNYECNIFVGRSGFKEPLFPYLAVPVVIYKFSQSWGLSTLGHKSDPFIWHNGQSVFDKFGPKQVSKLPQHFTSRAVKGW